MFGTTLRVFCCTGLKMYTHTTFCDMNKIITTPGSGPVRLRAYDPSVMRALNIIQHTMDLALSTNRMTHNPL